MDTPLVPTLPLQCVTPTDSKTPIKLPMSKVFQRIKSHQRKISERRTRDINCNFV